MIARGVLRREPDGAIVLAGAGAKLPGRELARPLSAVEERTQVDFARMEDEHVRILAALNEAYRAAQEGQIEEVVAQARAAGEDVAALGSFHVEPIDATLLAPHLQEAAEEGVRSARAERDAQLPEAEEPATHDEGAVGAFTVGRAAALAATLASGMQMAASKRATQLAGREDAPERLREYLTGLVGAEVNLQLGGAVQSSYGKGRLEFIRAQMQAAAPAGPDVLGGPPPPPKLRHKISVYGSEVLDQNTCSRCVIVDGTEYESLDDAEEDYPSGGGYIECEGGLRCRGTLIAEYEVL